MRRWILDASPIIALASAGYIHLVDALCGQVMIPSAVVDEICGPGRGDSAEHWIKDNCGKFVQLACEVDPVVAAHQLGAGESEVISEALQTDGVEAILDDRAARHLAISLGIRVRGTVGIVVLAKKEGLIPAVAPVLDDLMWVGLRLDDELVGRALRMAGEAT